MIGLSLYRRRCYCQLYDGTRFAANRNSISYCQRYRSRFDAIYIYAFLCSEPASSCAVIGNVW